MCFYWTWTSPCCAAFVCTLSQKDWNTWRFEEDPTKAGPCTSTHWTSQIQWPSIATWPAKVAAWPAWIAFAQICLILYGNENWSYMTLQEALIFIGLSMVRNSHLFNTWALLRGYIFPVDSATLGSLWNPWSIQRSVCKHLPRRELKKISVRIYS